MQEWIIKIIRFTPLQIEQILAEGERIDIGSFSATVRYIIRVYFSRSPR